MPDTDAKLNIDPELISKLSAESGKLWSAAHEDDSKNRINGDTILEASTYGAPIGIIAALLMWFRKKFRNRRKTKEDLAAEKEASRINRTCGALEEMLLEYIRAAQEGVTDVESLDELTDTLEEMHGYYQSGKLAVPGRQELAGIRRTVAEYTAAMEGSRSVAPARSKESSEGDEFLLIKELLLKQREIITG